VYTIKNEKEINKTWTEEEYRRQRDGNVERKE
jgi:hypothetical protein